MAAISARSRTRARVGLPVLVALAFLTGCIVPSLPAQNSMTAAEPPEPTAIVSATPASTIAPPTETAQPPRDTPLDYNCDTLDLPHAHLNQVLDRANAELERRLNEPRFLEATFAPLIKELTDLPPGSPTPTIDPTLVYEVQEIYTRNQHEINAQPCSVTGLWPSPDGAWIAVRIGSNPVAENASFFSLHSTIFRAWVVVYDTETLRPAWVGDYPQGLFMVKWSPTGQQLAVLGGDRGLQVRAAADGAIMATIPAPEPYPPSDRCVLGLDVGLPEQNFTWTLDEQKILRKAPGKIETWDAVTGSLQSEVPFDDATVGQLAGAYREHNKKYFCYVNIIWSPDARYMVTNDWHNNGSRPAQVWDAMTGEPVFSLKNHGILLTWSSTNLIYQQAEEDLQILDGQTGEPLDRQFLMGAAGGEGLWSPDGSKIAFYDSWRLTVYDVHSKTLSFLDRDTDSIPRLFVWLADSIHLLVLDHDNFEPQKLFLCDTRTGGLTGPSLPVPLR